MRTVPAQTRLLLIDTCGNTAHVALSQGATVVAHRELGERMASVELLAAIQTLLDAQTWTRSDITAVGVVSGPGSFTGVRIGMAAAKGICEALAIPLVTVSRLGVLAAASGAASGCAALNAGREEVYLRDAAGRESLVSLTDLPQLVTTGQLAIAEERLAAPLAELHPSMVSFSMHNALQLLLEKLSTHPADEVLTEANYVRGEAAIYAAIRPTQSSSK